MSKISFPQIFTNLSLDVAKLLATSALLFLSSLTTNRLTYKPVITKPIRKLVNQSDIKVQIIKHIKEET